MITDLAQFEQLLTGSVRAELHEQATGPDPRWATPMSLAAALRPGTVLTPALDLIDRDLVELANTRNGRLILTVPPQEGKSSAAQAMVVWLLKHRPWTRVLTASYGQSLANRNGRAIRNLITGNEALGLRVAADNGSASEWQLGGHDGGVLSVGVGAGATGRSADFILIDDPIKDRTQADSELQRQKVWDWWTDVASTRLSPGAPVALVLTRWHDDDLAGRLLKAEDGHTWKVRRLPALADHDPENGETDPLGRAPGEWLTSARGRTVEEWEAIRTRAGSRTFQALYQGRPSSGTGTVFQRNWWRRYNEPLWITRADGSRVATGMDEVILSWDMAFKDTSTSDYVVGQVWGRRGADAYLLDQFRDRVDFPGTVTAFRAQAALWPQALLKLVEDKANGTAVIASLTQQIPGIVPVTPDGGKGARASAVSPLVEAGNVYLPSPELAPWVTDLIEEHAAFPTGVHDDTVDSLTQGLNRLIIQPLVAGEVLDVEDVDPGIYEESWAAPY